MLKIKFTGKIVKHYVCQNPSHSILENIRDALVSRYRKIFLNPAHFLLMIDLLGGYKSYSCSSFLKISDFSVLDFL